MLGFSLLCHNYAIMLSLCPKLCWQNMLKPITHLAHLLNQQATDHLQARCHSSHILLCPPVPQGMKYCKLSPLDFTEIYFLACNTIDSSNKKIVMYTINRKTTNHTTKAKTTHHNHHHHHLHLLRLRQSQYLCHVMII